MCHEPLLGVLVKRTIEQPLRCSRRGWWGVDTPLRILGGGSRLLRPVAILYRGKGCPRPSVLGACSGRPWTERGCLTLDLPAAYPVGETPPSRTSVFSLVILDSAWCLGPLSLSTGCTPSMRLSRSFVNRKTLQERLQFCNVLGLDNGGEKAHSTYINRAGQPPATGIPRVRPGSALRGKSREGRCEHGDGGTGERGKSTGYGPWEPRVGVQLHSHGSGPCTRLVARKGEAKGD